MDADLKRRPMRIAAGGLLALASLFNLLLALGFLLGGAFAVQLGGLIGADAASFRAPELAESIGGSFVLGQILLICAGIIFIGAISVFASLYPSVIFVACAVAILAGLFGTFITAFGIPQTVGIVGGGLGAISALRIQLGKQQAQDSDRDGTMPRNIWDWLAVGLIVSGAALLVISTYFWFN